MVSVTFRRDYFIVGLSLLFLGFLFVAQPAYAGKCEDVLQTCKESATAGCADSPDLNCVEKAEAACTASLDICKQAEASAAQKDTDEGSTSNDYGLKETADAADLPNTDTNVAGLVGKIIQAALSLVATIFFFLMVYGGFLWMTARGNSDQIGKAKDLITQAIVGVVVISAAWAITNFVISRIG